VFGRIGIVFDIGEYRITIFLGRGCLDDVAFHSGPLVENNCHDDDVVELSFVGIYIGLVGLLDLRIEANVLVKCEIKETVWYRFFLDVHVPGHTFDNVHAHPAVEPLAVAGEGGRI